MTVGVLEVVLKQRLKIKNDNEIIFDEMQATIGLDESSENIIYLFTEFVAQALLYISREIN